MVKRTNVELVDDIDGSDAEETISFRLDKVDYEIDLSKKHADELRAAFAPYVGMARKKSGRSSRRRQGRSTGANAASAAEIRSWARENGWNVPERGRVSAEVREAYHAAG